MKTKVLNLDNKASGEVELKDEIFGLEPRADLIQRVVVWQLAKRRSGQHKVLTRAEVNRTKKKVYKQKGTGQARHGARSAPLFVGGAKAMGPVLIVMSSTCPRKSALWACVTRSRRRRSPDRSSCSKKQRVKRSRQAILPSSSENSV